MGFSRSLSLRRVVALLLIPVLQATVLNAATFSLRPPVTPPTSDASARLVAEAMVQRAVFVGRPVPEHEANEVVTSLPPRTHRCRDWQDRWRLFHEQKIDEVIRTEHALGRIGDDVFVEIRNNLQSDGGKTSGLVGLFALHGLNELLTGWWSHFPWSIFAGLALHNHWLIWSAFVNPVMRTAITLAYCSTHPELTWREKGILIFLAPLPYVGTVSVFICMSQFEPLLSRIYIRTKGYLSARFIQRLVRFVPRIWNGLLYGPVQDLFRRARTVPWLWESTTFSKSPNIASRFERTIGHTFEVLLIDSSPAILPGALLGVGGGVLAEIFGVPLWIPLVSGGLLYLLSVYIILKNPSIGSRRLGKRIVTGFILWAVLLTPSMSSQTMLSPASPDLPADISRTGWGDPQLIDNMIQAHADLQANISHSRPEYRERLAQAYFFFQFFRDGGNSHYKISDKGHELEDYYKNRIMAINVNASAKYPIKRHPHEYADEMIAQLRNQLPQLKVEDRQRIIDRFVNQPASVAISPLGAYALLAGALRHFGIARDVSLVMSEEKLLLLRVDIAADKTLNIRISQSGSEFDVAYRKPPGEPTMASIENFEVASEAQKHWVAGMFNHIIWFNPYGEEIHRISMSLRHLEFVEPIIAVLAPRLWPTSNDSAALPSHGAMIHVGPASPPLALFALRSAA